MAASAERSRSWVLVLALGLVGGLGWGDRAITIPQAQSTPVQTSLVPVPSGKTPLGQATQPTIHLADTTPFYPPSAPPERRTPLPDQRQQTEEQTIGSDYRISALQPDSQGALWVGSWQGLAKISPSTGVILNRVSLPNVTVGAIAQDKVGRIWVGTYEGLVRLDPKTGAVTAQNFALPSNRVLSLLIDDRGFLWVGTDAGLAMISPDRGLLKTTIKNLPGVSANALTLDKLGNLWVGTLEGLVEVDTAKAVVTRRVTDFPGSVVQTLAASPWGTLWVGTSTSLLEANIGIRRELKMVPVAQPTVAKPAKRGVKNRKAVPTQAAKAKPPQMRQQIVFVPDQETRAVKLRTVSQLNGRNITSLEFDQVSSLWVGTTTGLLRINPYNGVSGGEIPNLPSSRILAIAPDTGGKLWVGTSEGLGWVNTKTFQGHTHQTFQRTNPQPEFDY
jgi:ligand-binding sensor domain-containing protein